MSAEGFRKELEHLINCESMENGSNTPDFILADYLTACLAAFDAAVSVREGWYGRLSSRAALTPEPPSEKETP